MKLTNQMIYSYAYNLAQAFTDSTQVLPIKINFYLQKNKNELMKLAQDVEAAKDQIIMTYGRRNDDGSIQVPPESYEVANKELNDLFALEQDVKIYKVKFSDFSNDLNLNMGQMEALMFMIDDEE